MKKKLLGLLLAVSMVVSLTACGGGGDDASTDTTTTETADDAAADDAAETDDTAETAEASGDVLKIGVAAATTGSDPLEGERMVQALELAVQEYTDNGGAIQVELNIQDSQGTTDGALNAVQRLISDGCQVIIGPHKSTQVLAVGETVDAAGVPFVSGGTSPNLVGQFDTLFTCRTNDELTAVIGAQACIDELGAQKVGIFYGSDDYGSGGYTVASAYFEENGIEYVSEVYNSGDTDVSGQVLSLMNQDLDCILVWAHGADMPLIFRTMNQLGSEVPVVAASGIAIGQYLDLMEAEWVDGYYGIGEWIANRDSEVVQHFGPAFEEATGEPAEMFSATYYGAFLAVMDAVEKGGGTDSASIMEGLKQVSGLSVPLGTYTCDENQQLLHEAVLVQMDGKNPVEIRTITAE